MWIWVTSLYNPNGANMSLKTPTSVKIRANPTMLHFTEENIYCLKWIHTHCPHEVVNSIPFYIIFIYQHFSCFICNFGFSSLRLLHCITIFPMKDTCNAALLFRRFIRQHNHVQGKWFADPNEQNTLELFKCVIFRVSPVLSSCIQHLALFFKWIRGCMYRQGPLKRV